MKKNERDCRRNMYPMYQTPNMMPITNIPYGMPYSYQTEIDTSMSSGMYDNTLNNLDEKINMLDRRLTRLENTINSNKNNYQNYSDSNYHMM